MNIYGAAVARALQRHGVFCTYSRVQAGVYDADTDTVVNTNVTSTIRTYKKQINVNQFNYPNLIGKEVSEFYCLASELLVEPKVGDKIILDAKTFNVHSFKSHGAEGAIQLYCFIATR